MPDVRERQVENRAKAGKMLNVLGFKEFSHLSLNSRDVFISTLGTLSMATPSTQRGRQFFQLISVAR